MAPYFMRLGFPPDGVFLGFFLFLGEIGMQSKEVLALVETVHNEKRIEKEDVFSAMEAALAVAVARMHSERINVRVAIDRETGDYKVYRRWEVVDDDDEAFVSSDLQIILSEAVKRQKGLQSQQYLEEPLPYAKQSRISAHKARQVIVQKIREYERASICKSYRERGNKMLSGLVRRDERSGVVVELDDGIEAFIPRELMIPNEKVRIGHRIRAYIQEICENTHGAQIILSRIVPELLSELFKLEVPEISQGLLEIIGVARDPGFRAKMTVRTNAPTVDPVGACVGMRGSRVQAVSSELAGERVDIITWDQNFAQYVINAMEPADVSAMVVDEDKKFIDVAVEESQLPQAIGRNGQNVKLASQLLGWRINVISVQEANEKREKEAAEFVSMFREKLGVDEEVAIILAQEGFSDIEEIAYTPKEELAEIEEFDEEIVRQIHVRANDFLLKTAIEEEKNSIENIVSSILKDTEQSEQVVMKLLGNGISNRDDLADLATDDLLGIVEMDTEVAGKLIMEARAHWFQN